MGPEDRIPMTEDFLLYILGLVARQRGSRVFFKISHNMSLNRGWHFYCAPDMDLVEVRPDNTIVAYEVKGQRRRKDSYDWPALQDGLNQALRYLIMPKVTNHSPFIGMFKGGIPDLVYLVHPIPSHKSLDPLDLKVISLTPVGFIGIMPVSIDRKEIHALDVREQLRAQLDKVIEVVLARQNPLQDARAKAFFLDNLASLEKFGEESKIFNRRVKQAALECLGILPKGRFVADQMVTDRH